MEYLQVIAALVFVLALMGGLALLLKKLGLSGALPTTAQKEKRLKLLEALPLDGRRKLLLLKRDNQEHVILIGGNTDIVIESNIKSTDNEDHDS